MKLNKKLISVVLAVLLVFSGMSTAFAATNDFLDSASGTIYPAADAKVLADNVRSGSVDINNVYKELANGKFVNVLKQFQAWGQAAKKYADDHNTTIQDAFKNNASEIIPAVEAAGNAVEQKTHGEIMGMSEEEVKALEDAKKAYNEAVAKAKEAGVELSDDMTVADDCKDKAKFEAATKAINAKIAEGDKLAAKNVAIVDSTKLNIEFNRVLTDDEKAKVKVTIEGADKTLGAWNEGNTAVDVASTFVDETEYAIVVMLDDEKLYDQKLKYDINEITNLEVLTADLNCQIGSEMTIEVKLTDEDGDAIEGKEVKFESPEKTNKFEKAIELAATTDDKGVAEFKWTRTHDYSDNVTVYCVEKPVVRVESSITWVLADTSLVRLNSEVKKDMTLSDQSVFEFTITAKKENGENYIGDIVLDFEVTDEGTNAASLQDNTANSNIKIQSWNQAEEKWECGVGSSADAKIHEKANKQAVYKMVAKDNGSKKFRVYTKSEGNLNAKDVEDIVITAWYNKDGAAGMGAKDPRAVTGKIAYVPAKPVITFEQIGDASVVATTAVSPADDKDFILYNLSVKDQFGNPYRGTVSVADFSKVDDDVATAAINATFAVDTKCNGSYDITAAALRTIDTTLAAAKGSGDVDFDSTMKIKMVNATADENIIPTAFVNIDAEDKDDADSGSIDSDDVYVKTENITSKARRVAELVMTPESKDKPAAGELYVWKVSGKDQFGADFTAKSSFDDVEMRIVDADGKNIKGSANVDIYVDTNDTVSDPIVSGDFEGSTESVGDDADVVLNTQDIDSSGAVPFYVAVKGGKADETYTVTVWAEVDKDNAYNKGEAKAEAKVTYVAKTVSGGKFNATVNNATAAGKSGNYVAELKNGTDGSETVTYTYELVDQTGAKDASATNNVNFTVKNNSETSVMITVEGGSAVELAKGATGEYSAAATAGDITLKVNPGKGTKNVAAEKNLKISVDITASIENIDGSEKKSTLYYADYVSANEDKLILGKLMDVMNLKGNGTSFFMMESKELGYVKVDFAANGTFSGTKTYNVGGTQVSAQADFESFLKTSVGNDVKVKQDGSNAITVDLTK